MSLEEFSEIIDPSSYNGNGFCEGYEARRHRSQNTAIAGSQRCRADFTISVGGLNLDDIVTYENEVHGHIVTVLMPHVRPERMELMSYLSEYFCLHDDQQDFADRDTELAMHRKLARKQLLGKMLAQFTAVDQTQSQAVIVALMQYTKIAATLKHSTNFRSIEAYIEYRFHDYASEFILAATMFGMDMDPMSAEERDTMEPFIRLGFQAMSLINDYFSFDIEYASTPDKGALINGVSVLMRLHCLGVAEAREGLKTIAIGFDQEYMRRWNALRSQGSLSDKLQTLLSAIAYQMVGKMIWSQTTLRYNVAYRLGNRKRTDSVTQDSIVQRRERNDSVIDKAVAGDAVKVTVVEVAPTDVERVQA